METFRLQSIDTDIHKAAELLRSGELVAFPTETVYGLGASIFDEAAIQEIYTVKGRPQDNPIIAHVASIEQIKTIAINISSRAQQLITSFFPGPLTLVLERKDTVPSSISGGLPTIAVRMPKHETALKLIQRAGIPLVAPSANLSGKPSPTTASHVLEDLDGKIAAVIDGGVCDVGIESTVLDLTRDIPLILRPGVITQQDIEKVLGETIDIFTKDTETTPLPSPGMKYRHYAPDAQVIVVQAEDADSKHFSDTLILSNVSVNGENIIVYPLTTQTLYKSLREADERKIKTVTIILDDSIKTNSGLLNRIKKAAGKN